MKAKARTKEDSWMKEEAERILQIFSGKQSSLSSL